MAVNIVKFRLTVEGTQPLIMNSSRSVDVLDPLVAAKRRLTGKQKKTEADYEEIARLEWSAALYLDKDAGPFIPGDNFWRCLYDAGKKHKLGPKIKEGVFFPERVNPIAYKGPKDKEGLWNDKKFRLGGSVVVNRARIMKTRPQFLEWMCEADGHFDAAVINFSELEMVVETAGTLVGIGDWRPRYGRFNGQLERL